MNSTRTQTGFSSFTLTTDGSQQVDLTNQINYKLFSSLKGEFEAEGLSRTELSAEALFAARRGIDYLVKISGAEAKSDISFLEELGIVSIVCPMIESRFAMEKYMGMLRENSFQHIGVTIETVTAVSNIDKILDAGHALTEVTIGRTDLTASFKGEGVESAQTIEMVKTVAAAAHQRKLKVTMGGSVSRSTRDLLRNDSQLRGLIHAVETRKAVMPINQFLEEGTLSHALKLEELLLRNRIRHSERPLPDANARLVALTERA